MSAPPPREDRPARAVAVALVCFLIFTFMDTIAKYLAGQGYSPLQVAFSRYGFHFLAVLVFLLPREGREILRAARPSVQLLRGAMLLTSTVLNFFALRYLPLPVTISIFFSMPLLVCLLSIPLLGESVGPRRFAAVGAGFLGVLVITEPWTASFHPAVFLSLGAALTASLYFVLTRMVAGADTNATSQFYSAGLATLVLALPALAVWQNPATSLHLGLMIVIGLFGFAGHALLTFAYRLAPASTLAPVVYSQIFYATGVSWLVFGVLPGTTTYIGAAIIIGSGLYIWLRERRLDKAPSPLGPTKTAGPSP